MLAPNELVLAARRVLRLNGEEVAATPILVPSFSSKGIAVDVKKAVEWAEQFIDGPTLVSAYDLYYKKITPPFTFPSLILLDSGGYEASKDMDLSELGEKVHRPKKWTRDMHEQVLADWRSALPPTVFISYDHPKERLTVPEQIERARQLAPGRTDIMREVLLKPETTDATLLKVESILPHVGLLRDFDVIGVTEKEIGNSIFHRMTNIAKLRSALTKARLDLPIHVFGSLDTVTTSMYFVAGADIFDGLTWLRFAYFEGNTIYRHIYGALKLGITTREHLVDGQCWSNNLGYLADRTLEMRNFIRTHDFANFKFHPHLIEDAYRSLLTEIGGENGR